MARLGEYFNYDDSSIYIWRKGDEVDPFVECSDTVKVVLNRGVLNEIPDPYTKVMAFALPQGHSFTEEQLSDMEFLETEESIDSMYEVDTKIYNAPKTPGSNQYIVNYANGVITFHPDMNARDVVCIYKGRGRILIPAVRIWISADNPYAVENLQEFVDLATIKIEEVDEQIRLADESTQYANSAGDFANDAGFYAKQQGDRINYSIDMNKIVQIETERAKDFAIDAGEQALDARDKAIDARNRTILIWQSPVDDYDDLLSTYPHPEVGWTVLLNNSGVVYRFDGANWLEIGNMTLSTPLANENVDGLMSRNGFVKLRDIEEEAQVNYTGEDAKDVLPDYFKTKVICFVIPDTLEIGIQNIIINFPYDGEIVDIKVSLGIEGTDSTKIDIEKISEQDFKDKEDWESVLEDKIFIDYGERVDDKSFIISEIEVNKNDYFRVNILEAGIGASNLTILIEIKI